MILKLNFSCDLCSLYRDSNEKQQVCTNVLINLIQHKNIAKRIYILLCMQYSNYVCISSLLPHL